MVLTGQSVDDRDHVPHRRVTSKKRVRHGILNPSSTGRYQENSAKRRRPLRTRSQDQNCTTIGPSYNSIYDEAW